jgi:hypothetical protein
MSIGRLPKEGGGRAENGGRPYHPLHPSIGLLCPKLRREQGIVCFILKNLKIYCKINKDQKTIKKRLIYFVFLDLYPEYIS